MPDSVQEILTTLLGYAVTVAWIAGVSALLIWLSGKIRTELSESLTKRGKDPTVAVILDNLIRFATFFVIGLFAITAISGDPGATVTAVGLIAAAVSLSLQDVLRNFVSGIYLLLERPFKPGDTIRVIEQKGVVDRIDIRTTVLLNAAQETVFVPNFKVFSEMVRKESDFYSTVFTIQSPGAVHETFEAIWNAALSVQVDPSMPPTVKITGADNKDVDFEAIIWQAAHTDQSEAFIAGVKTSLPEATIQKKPA